MNNLVQCSRCRSVLIAEEFESHKCKVPIKKHIEIIAGLILDLTTYEEKTLLVDGLNGVSYMIKLKTKGEALPWPPNENTRDNNQTGTTQNQISQALIISLVASL